MLHHHQVTWTMKSHSNIQVMKLDNALVPLTEYDAIQLEDCSKGTLFNLKKTKKRSNPQNALYWATLRKVREATGKWPTDEHLHNDLKWACGYVRMRYNALSGQHMRTVDSISFDQMDQQEFNAYFEMAMKKLAEGIGYDPLRE